MNDPRWPEIERLVLEALELEDHELPAFLEKACAGDAELRERVEGMLRSHQLCDPKFSNLDATATPKTPRRPGDETMLSESQMLGKYRILRKIGEGGMATVYLAVHEDLKSQVALKVLPRFATSSQERVERFKREAITVAKLQHPGIVAVNDVGEDQGVHFLVMNYIDGPTYAQYLAEARVRNRDSKGQTVASRDYVNQQCDWIAKVAEALHHAHQKGIVHRDVKPSNILLQNGEEPLLTDFGVSKNLLEPSNTATGQLAGTVPYMSPEQARAVRNTIDPRSDVFSLGVVLYEALTLRQPFTGETVEESVRNVLFRHPPKVNQLNPSVPRDLVTICHMALEKDPQHRYPTAAHMAGDLQSFLDGRPILASPPSLARRCREFVRHRRVAVLVTATIVLGAVLSGVTVSYSAYREKTQGHITIDSTIPGSRVVVQRLDYESRLFGEERYLGKTPLDEYLMPGHHRFTVTDPKGGVRRASVVALSGVEQAIEIRSTAHMRSVEDMIFIAGGVAADGTLLDSFEIDRCEVSNRDYQQFVEETGYPEPMLWRKFGYPSEYPNHPVVSVSWEDAQAYCRWAGLRLPTAREWQYAMTRPDGRNLPWGDDVVVPFKPPVKVEVEQGAHGLMQPFQEYLTNTAPVDVDEHPSSLGILHAAGNVCEYTDTTFTEVGVLLKGGRWKVDPAKEDLHSEYMAPLRTDSINGGVQGAWLEDIGFRCARSLDSNNS